MEKQVFILDNTQVRVGKKSSIEAVKDAFVESEGRLGGDGPSLGDENLALKIPGGRLNGSSGSKDRNNRKDENSNAEDVEIKAPEATEGVDEEAEGQHRRGQDGETLMQWYKRKQPRFSEPAGLLNKDRRVVRADNQVAAQPASRCRGNILRPLNRTVPEAASGKAKSTTDVSGSAVLHSEYDNCQSIIGSQPQNGDQEDFRQQHQRLASNPENASASSSGCHTVAAPFSLQRADGESLQEKSLAKEKMNLEPFEWPKIVTSLTMKEKEDDFNATNGTKLPQFPKRRSKSVRRSESGAAKRTTNVSGSAVTVMHSEYNNSQSISGSQSQSGGDQEEFMQQHQRLASNPEKAPASKSGVHTMTAPGSLQRADGEASEEKNLAKEKMNLEPLEWPKIMTSLTMKEKEDDFNAINGTKLPQFPKRRSKSVRRSLQLITPGTCLSRLLPERYEVREWKTEETKPMDLKAIGNGDSDSEESAVCSS